jgi:uncharacterized membrane protein YdjX (TVP38/TMEM64 family)
LPIPFMPDSPSNSSTHDVPPPADAASWRAWLPSRPIALAAIAIVLVVGLFWLLPSREWVIQAYYFIRSLNRWQGIGACVLVYTLLSIVGLPTSPLAVGAGLLFGLLLGFLASMAGVMSACIICFIVARYIARGWVLRRVRRKPRLRAILKGFRHENWQMILLTRLNPLLPAAVASYLFGVTPIRFSRYAAASFIGNIPLCLTLAYLGSAGQLALGRHNWTSWDYTLWGAGLVATVALTWWITRYTKRRLANPRMKAEG